MSLTDEVRVDLEGVVNVYKNVKNVLFLSILYELLSFAFNGIGTEFYFVE